MDILETDRQRLSDQEDRTQENSIQVSQGPERFLSIMERANEIAGAIDSSILIQDFLDLIIEVTRADSAIFFQMDAARDEFVITHVRGDAGSQYLVGLHLNRQQGLTGISLRDTKLVVIGDLPGDQDWLRVVDPTNTSRRQNVIHLPVANKDHVLGVIQIFSFQQADMDLLLVLGNRLAVEMEHRREIEAYQRSNKRLMTLVDMLGEVAGTLDRNRLLHMVTENASRLVDAERSSIFLVDPYTSEMIFQVSYRSPEQPLSPESTDNLNRPTKFISSDQPVSNNSIRQANLSNLPEEEFSYFNRSAITVPLRSEPLTQDHTNNSKHVLGGLMVLNKQSNNFLEEDAQLMRILANQASTFLQIVEIYESSGELFLGVIKSLVTAIEARDIYTQGHSQRVSDYSVLIARELGLDETLVNDIRIGSLLHDIGKIGIPDSILLKKGKLNNKEMGLMKKHPRTGVNILSQVKLLDPMMPAILEHHERMDGSGYPSNLTDQQISLMGRIVAIADVFDAMTSNRPYRQPIFFVDVLSYLHENAGILFDAQCVQALDNILSRSN